MYKILHLFSAVLNLKKCGKILLISLNRHTIWEGSAYLPKLGCYGETFRISTSSRVLYGNFQPNNCYVALVIGEGVLKRYLRVEISKCP